MALSFIPPENDEYPRWVTETQIRYLEAVKEHGGQNAAARALGVAKSSVNEAIATYKREAARRGHAPGHFDDGVAPGFVMGKVTIQRGPGGVERVWERQSPEHQDRLRGIEAMVRHVAADVAGMSPLRPGPGLASSSLMATYWFGDPHFGLGSSAEDGGDDTDIDDTDRLTRAGVDALVSRMPPTQRAIFGFIGDNTHANDSSALTPGHKNPLDIDVRGFGAAFLSAARAICYAVTRGLEKHDEIEVWVLPGNHDPDAAFGIAVAVSMFFDNNRRVTVRLSRDYLWWTTFGRNLIAAHHGDKIKPMDLHGVLSNDCKAVWAEIDYRYVFQGHIHHDTVTEYQQTRFESLRTLSKQDAWHRGKGYRSMRDTRAVLYHERYGEAERYTVSAAMLEDQLAA
jgi:hypothetical protein